MGEFHPCKLPAPLELRLKPGAHVTFTQIDQAERRINGTAGRVVAVGVQEIGVALSGSGNRLSVERARWADFAYRWNPQKREIERMETGSYTQFPLVP